MNHDAKLSVGDWVAAVVSFFLLGYLLFVLVGFAVMGSPMRNGVAPSSRSMMLSGCLMPVLALGISALNSVLFLKSRLRKKRRLLADRWKDVHGVCAICGHDLTDDLCRYCPECGAAIPASARSDED